MPKHIEDSVLQELSCTPIPSKEMMYHLSNAFVFYLTDELNKRTVDEDFYTDARTTFLGLSAVLNTIETEGDTTNQH